MSGIPFWDPITRGYEENREAFSEWDVCYLKGRNWLIEVPGITTVKCTVRMKIQVNKVHGADGASTVEQGYEPSKVELTVKIWTPEHWERFQAMVDKLWRVPGKPSRLDRPARAKPSSAAGLTTAAADFIRQWDKRQPPIPGATGDFIKLIDAQNAERAKYKALVQSEAEVRRPTERQAVSAITIVHPVCKLYKINEILFEELGSPEPVSDPKGAMAIRIRCLQYIAPKPKATRKVQGAPAPTVELNRHHKKNYIGKPPSETDARPVQKPAPAWLTNTS